jgi:hypothetical protein
MKLHTHYVDLLLEFASSGMERLPSSRMVSPQSKIGFARLLQKASCLLLIAVAALILAQGVAYAQDQGQAASAGDYYVHVGAGVDSAQCGTTAYPCQSIERAIQNATTDSTIHVATGVYTYRGTNNPCNIYLGYSAVACIVNKRVTLYGGYASDWSQRNPALYPFRHRRRRQGAGGCGHRHGNQPAVDCRPQHGWFHCAEWRHARGQPGQRPCHLCLWRRHLGDLRRSHLAQRPLREQPRNRRRRHHDLWRQRCRRRAVDSAHAVPSHAGEPRLRQQHG